MDEKSSLRLEELVPVLISIYPENWKRNGGFSLYAIKEDIEFYFNVERKRENNPRYSELWFEVNLRVKDLSANIEAASISAEGDPFTKFTDENGKRKNLDPLLRVYREIYDSLEKYEKNERERIRDIGRLKLGLITGKFLK